MLLFEPVEAFHIKRIKREYKKLLSQNVFDLSSIDLKIAARVVNLGVNVTSQSYQSNDLKRGVVVLATELYDTGGHTPVMNKFIDSIVDDYSVSLLLSRLHNSRVCAPLRHRDLEEKIFVGGVNDSRWHFKKNVSKLYRKIVETNASKVVVFTHPHDFLAVAVLALVKKHTSINVIFYNHADHLPSLAISLSDLVVNCRHSGVYITQYLRKISRTVKLPLQSLAKDETVYLTCDQQLSLRRGLGVQDDEQLTLSGFDGHKIFSDSHDQYLKLIKTLLMKRPNLKHVLISNLNEEQLSKIEQVFLDAPEARSRFLLKGMVSQFNELFQSCDLFIDSFPLGSALTHIDMMRNKKPTVVKINTENALYSFEDYLPKDYKYAFSNLDDMGRGIERLLDEPAEAQRVVEENYQHYLNTNEYSVVKKRYLDLLSDDSYKDCVEPIIEKGSIQIGCLSTQV
jgi:hypothetical protein